MIDLDRFSCLGAAFRESFAGHANDVCVIEADRARENVRFTYREFETRAGSLAADLAARGFGAGDRAAVILTNQSKWHLAAVAVFHLGGVLVPLDFKLNGAEHLRLLAHCRPRLLVVEHHLWRAMATAENFEDLRVEDVLVVDAPGAGALPAPAGTTARAWPDEVGNPAPPIAERRREDPACIVYSSGTGGRPKGCLLTHGNYLEQLRALTRLHPFGPGVRYLSVLPTNHAIDFMVGFVGPYLCGATVVHLRTIRPEFVREAFTRYRITHMALVPMVLKNLEGGLRERFAALSSMRRALFDGLVAINGLLSGGRPRPRLARRLLRPVHEAFGGALEALFVGGAYTDPDTLRFFHRLGLPVANGYGLTEAGTALTLDSLDPPRPDTVGRPLPGVELKILSPGPDGVGEVAARGPTIMIGYLDDPELTAETIVDGWLLTGDLGRLDEGCLRILGRKKNMIVTEGGKNIYPEDVETAFEGLAVKEFCVFATRFLWPERSAREESLVLVAHVDESQVERPDPERLREDVAARNRGLADFKRVSRMLLWDRDFPKTASLKVKRGALAQEIAACPQAQPIEVS